MQAQTFNFLDKVVEQPRNSSNLYHEFGRAISIDGNFAIVGAPEATNPNSNGGAAYIYEKVLGNWVFRQRIMPNDSTFSVDFGWSVYIKGDLVIVGDPYNRLPISTSPSTFQVGAAYIFQRQTNGTWIQVRQLRSPVPSIPAQFGFDVAIDNDVAVVGERGYNPGVATSGAAHVFRRNAGNWANTPTLNTLQGDRTLGDFGVSVDIEGNNLIVGQSSDDLGNGATPEVGSVFLFRYNAGAWSAPQKIAAGDGEPYDFFGWSVAISGDYAIVGSYPHRLDVNGNVALLLAGAAYILHNNNGTWAVHQKIVASDRLIQNYTNANGATYGSVFGFDVDIDEEHVIVGAFAASKDALGQNSKGGAGIAYTFRKQPNNNWIETQKIVGLHRDSIDHFGICVGISGLDIAVGSNYDWDDVTGNPANRITEAGSAYFFSGVCPISINKTVSGTASVGGTFTYSIEVCNPCASTVNNVFITDTLSPNLAIFNAGSFTYSSNGHHLSTTISLPPNSCSTLTFVVTPLVDGDNCGKPLTINNCASVAAPGDTVRRSCVSILTTPTAPIVNTTVSNFSSLIGTVLLPQANAVNNAQTVTVSGHWIMDVPNYTFATNSVIIMAPGAQITVLVNNALSLEGTTVRTEQPCNYMWRSITVQGGILFVKNSTIRGGQYAIEAFNKSQISVQGSTFTNNFIGIYVPPATSINPQQVIISAFIGNRFQSTTQGLPLPYPGHSPIPLSPVAGAVGLAGILVNDLLTLDLRQAAPISTANANTFEDLASGVVGIKSSMLIDGCIFQRINDNNPYFNIARYNGVAIYLNGDLAANHSLTQTGYGSNSTINFNNVGTAIVAFRANVKSTDNRIRNTQTGIRTALCQNKTLVLANNFMEVGDVGISLLQNDAAFTTTTVSGNTIRIPNASSAQQATAGIFVTEGNNGYPLFISENNIRMENSKDGLLLQGNSKGVIIENNITFTQNIPSRTGYFSAGTQNNLVSCNDVRGTTIGSINTLDQRAYWIANASGGDYTCNSADFLPVGMLFDANNSINLRGTRFNRHFYGLWLRPGASVGNQSFTGNRFVANTPNNGRREAINQSLTVGNQFTINAPQNTPLWPSPRFPNNGWIIPGTGTDFNCNSPLVFCPTGPVLRPTPPVNNLDTLVATGAMSANNTQVNEHIGKRQLYRKLKELGNPSGLFQNFSTNEATTPVGLFDRISELSDSLCRPDSICMHNANALQAAIAQYIAQIRQLDSLYSLNGNPQHLAQIDVLQDSLSSKTAQENLIWSNIQTTRDNTATLLDIDNSNITVAAIFEDNEKKVNEVYLNSIAKGIADYTADQLAILQFVAGQCPWDGGNAVFRARGMLALVQRVIISDESMCEAKSLPEDYNHGEKTVIEDIFVENDYLKLYPNPAQNYISIELQSEIDAKIESVEIFNLNGQKLKSYLNTSAQELLQIELESLSEGMYICRVIMSDNSIQTLKFSVIK